MSEKKKISKKKSPSSAPKKKIEPSKYIQAIGRRKLSVSAVKIFPNSNENGERNIQINNKDYKKYFPLAELQEIVSSPLKKASIPEIKKIIANVKGGGIRGQAESTRLAIAKALVLYDSNLKKPLRDIGYLTRDARTVERKKAGLKKARRAPQFSKR